MPLLGSFVCCQAVIANLADVVGGDGCGQTVVLHRLSAGRGVYKGAFSYSY